MRQLRSIAVGYLPGGRTQHSDGGFGQYGNLVKLMTVTRIRYFEMSPQTVALAAVALLALAIAASIPFERDNSSRDGLR